MLNWIAESGVGSLQKDYESFLFLIACLDFHVKLQNHGAFQTKTQSYYKFF